MPINFFTEEVDTPLNDIPHTTSWLMKIAAEHQHKITELNYIFCSDDYLLKINQEHLNHDYFTDIITFDHSEDTGFIEGDVFISVDRVRDNSETLQVQFLDELHRVIVHGLLHLLGYNDKSESEQKVMREKEDACISLLHK